LASKYNAKVTTTPDGIKHPSAKEARRWGELILLEKAGEIRNLRRQVVIALMGQLEPIKTRTGRQMKLTVDFAYEDKRLNWAHVFEESKGMRTRDYDVRLAIAQAMGIAIKET